MVLLSTGTWIATIMPGTRVLCMLVIRFAVGVLVFASSNVTFLAALGVSISAFNRDMARGDMRAG